MRDKNQSFFTRNIKYISIDDWKNILNTRLPIPAYLFSIQLDSSWTCLLNVYPSIKLMSRFVQRSTMVSLRLRLSRYCPIDNEVKRGPLSEHNGPIEPSSSLKHLDRPSPPPTSLHSLELFVYSGSRSVVEERELRGQRGLGGRVLIVTRSRLIEIIERMLIIL